MKDNKGQVCFRLFPFASPLGPLVGPAVAGPLSGSIQLPQASLPFGGPFCCQAPPLPCAGISFGVSVSRSHTPGIQERAFVHHAGLTLLHVGKLCCLLPEFWTAALIRMQSQGTDERTHTYNPQSLWCENSAPGPSQLTLWTLGGCVFSAFVLLGRDFGFVKVILFGPECIKCHILTCPYFYVALRKPFTYKGRGNFQESILFSAPTLLHSFLLIHSLLGAQRSNTFYVCGLRIHGYWVAS